MHIKLVFLAIFSIIIGSHAINIPNVVRVDPATLSPNDANAFLGHLNTEIKEIIEGRSSNSGKDELRRRLLGLPDLKLYFSAIVKDITEFANTFVPVREFLSQVGFGLTVTEVLAQCSEQKIKEGNWDTCVNHIFAFVGKLGFESGCYNLGQTDMLTPRISARFQDSLTQKAVCGFASAYMTASIKYLLTSKTPLLGWISQHFDRFMQSAVVGNYAEAWRQIHFFVTEQRRQLETHPIVLAWERSMGLLMKGEQPPVGDLQYAGFLPPKFAIQNKQTGLCIHPKSGDNNVPDGTVAHLWTGCDADYVKYEFTRTGAIRHVKSGKCLHPNQGKSDRGTRFHFWTGCDLDYLPFQLRADGNLQHVKSNQCLVPVGTFRPRNGTPLNIWDYCAKDDRTTYNIVA